MLCFVSVVIKPSFFHKSYMISLEEQLVCIVPFAFNILLSVKLCFFFLKINQT